MSIDVSTVFGSGTAATETTTTTASNTLDSQAFLTLLVAQLRNQDPSNPMDSSQLMTQTAQLTTNETLSTISDTSRESFALQMRIAAAGLVGQQVTYTGADDKVVTGIVTAVSYASGVPTVTVGKDEVPLDSVSTVTTPPAAPTTTTSTEDSATDDSTPAA